MKKTIAAIFMATFLLTGCTSETSQTEETIRIGYIGALTGDVASMGQDEKAVIEMFLEENPTINGKKVEVIFEDAQCNGQKAATAAQKLIYVDKVEIILGGLCSGETLSIAPLAEKERVVVFSTISTSPEVTNAGDYIFRNAPSDKMSSVVMANIISKSYTKTALLTENNDYGVAYRKNLLKELKSGNVEVVVDETFNSGTTDFKSILQKVKQSDAESLMALPGSTGGGFIVRQSRELGIDLPIYGGDAFSASEFFEIAKNTAEGTTIVMTAANLNRTGVKDYMEEFKSKYNRLPSAEAYALLGNDRINIIFNAIKEVGYNGEKIKDYLYEMPEYKGLGGNQKFDKNGDTNILPSVMVAKDGKFILKE